MSDEMPNGADFSQWGEQKIILDFFGEYRGTFLDLGAYDGATGSNTRGLSDRYWHGCCIEASPVNFVRLLENHRLNEKITCVNAAVMPFSGVVEFHDTFGQVATCMPINRVGEWVQRRYYVAAITPDQIVEKLGQKWDFVNLDIEGVDLDVLRVSHRLLQHTKLICVEDAQPAFKLNEYGYYDALMDTLRDLGFTRLVGRTTVGDQVGNTLMARP